MYEFLQNLGQNIVNGIGQMFSWLGNVFIGMFNALKEFFASLFRPLLLFFQGFWYLITKCFDIVVLAVQVIFGLFKVLMSIIIGVFNTFSGLMGFSGSSDYHYVPGVYQQGYNGVANVLNQTGFSTIAIIMTVFIWLATTYAVVRIAGGDR